MGDWKRFLPRAARMEEMKRALKSESEGRTRP